MIRAALMYDFDKTLSYKDMQEFTFIPSLGYKKTEDFWKDVTKFRKAHQMDGMLAYMYLMLEKAKEQGHDLTKKDFRDLGKDIELYPGVTTWFKRINRLAAKKGVALEHYIISSGIKEIVEGTPIASEFKKIYACSFLYNQKGVAQWPAMVVNYTTKTQYPYRVNKQVLDETEDYELNRYTKQTERPIPFSRMIYIGDGLTDVPCMKMVKENGGHSIAVYNPRNAKMKAGAKDLFIHSRVDFMAEADYRSHQSLEKLILEIVESIYAEKVLEDEATKLGKNVQ